MNRTALIAAVLSVIPLTAAATTSNADPFYRGGGAYQPGYSVPVAPPVAHYGYGGYHRPHFDHPRRHWRPMPPWRRWSYWR